MALDFHETVHFVMRIVDRPLESDIASFQFPPARVVLRSCSLALLLLMIDMSFSPHKGRNSYPSLRVLRPAGLLF